MPCSLPVPIIAPQQVSNYSCRQTRGGSPALHFISAHAHNDGNIVRLDIGRLQLALDPLREAIAFLSFGLEFPNGRNVTIDQPVRTRFRLLDVGVDRAGDNVLNAHKIVMRAIGAM